MDDASGFGTAREPDNNRRASEAVRRWTEER